MSPTSYQTALPRDGMGPGREQDKNVRLPRLLLLKKFTPLRHCVRPPVNPHLLVEA